MARASASGELTRDQASGAVEFGPAGPADESQCRALLRVPMEGAVSIALEREPDSRIAASIEGDRHHTIVARDRNSGRLLGIGSRAVRKVWIDGRPQRLGYLGQLRRIPAMRGRMRLLATAFAEMERTRRPDEVQYDLTSIAADNLPARRLLERGIAGLPVYRPLCEVDTMVMPASRRTFRRLPQDVSRGSDALISRIADCLQRNLRRFRFAPVWTEDDLRSATRTRGLDPTDFLVIRRGDRVTACLALWDQREFKQVRVTGYVPRLKLVRPWLNAGLRMASLPRLPAAGRTLDLGYLSHLAVDEDDPASMQALMVAARRAARQRGLDRLALGLTTVHPLRKKLRLPFGCREYRSRLYLVHDGSRRLPASALQGGTPHVEVGTL